MKLFSRKNLAIGKFTLFTFLLTVLLVIIRNNFNKIDLSLIINKWYVSLTIILLALFIIFSKSLMLYFVGSLYNVKGSFLGFVKVFCSSCFIESTTFTGKIGADGFKYFLWKDLPRKKRISLFLFLRTADIFGVFIVLIFLFNKYLIFVIIIIYLLIYILRRRNIELIFFKKKLFQWLLLCLISTLVYLAIIVQFSVVFYSLGLPINKDTLLIFMISHILGALSQLPFGLGVKDFTLFYQLREFLSQGEIIMGLIWIRFFGEFIPVILGALFIWKKVKK